MVKKHTKNTGELKTNLNPVNRLVIKLIKDCKYFIAILKQVK